ncbi:hypothetical protein AB0H57_00485 [Micromonospora sp. NPDC050686]|uniref:hypothetical protein n=1 Tax=Micromonospora sp. NPDC050686 TaxID=3154631 RepID=UPI0033F37171
MALPDDYVRLVATYGQGCFDDFLWVLSEGSGNPHLDLAEQTRTMREILGRKQNPGLHATLADHGVSATELIQWATTDGADSLLWLPVGPPGSWQTIVVEAGALSFSVLDQSTTAILFDLLRGALRLPQFPDDFPGDEPRFVPVD